MDAVRCVRADMGLPVAFVGGFPVEEGAPGRAHPMPARKTVPVGQNFPGLESATQLTGTILVIVDVRDSTK